MSWMDLRFCGWIVAILVFCKWRSLYPSFPGILWNWVGPLSRNHPSNCMEFVTLLARSTHSKASAREKIFGADLRPNGRLCPCRGVRSVPCLRVCGPVDRPECCGRHVVAVKRALEDRARRRVTMERSQKRVEKHLNSSLHQ